MVKQGYKETEIGIIPEAWRTCSIECDFDYIPNNTYSRDCMNDSSGFVHNIHYGDVLIKYGFVLDCESEKIPFINSSISVNTTNRLIQSGDVIIADTAEDETVGKAIEVVNVGNMRIVSGLHTYFLRAHADLFAPRYLGYFINSTVYHNQLLPHIVGTKVSSISKKGLNETVVLRPPLPEQRRIAEALSDVDSLIESLEKLIAKKKAIKQGAMQELLTGKKRLPGFTGEWVERSFSDIFIHITSNKYQISVNEYEQLGSFPVVDQGKKEIIAYSNQNVKAYSCPPCGIIIFGDHTRIFKYVNFDFIVGADGTQILECQNGYSTEYMYFCCNIVDIPNTGYNRHFKYLKDTLFYLSSEYSEQTAIANVLSDMDSEIAELEQKLSKYRNIKTGMMQTLLTGKIRLPEEKVIENAAIAKQEDNATVKTKKPHNRQFDDAVAIAAIVNAFYSEKYPLGRKKVQKLLYLMRRKQEVDTTEFKKKAAGPYAESIRYRGGEKILKENGYVNIAESPDSAIFSKGENIGAALKYVTEWNWQSVIDWLLAKFRYVGKDKLEILATVDMAICDLIHSGLMPSLETVKHLIASNEAWKAKLEKPIFSDKNITQTIDECYQLFNYSRG